MGQAANIRNKVTAKVRQQLENAASLAGPKLAADNAKRQAEASGEIFDPATDPRTAVVYNADGSQGNIDYATQLASRDRTLLNRAGQAVNQSTRNTATSRANADASAGKKPVYQAQAPYQAPTYTEMDPYQMADPYQYGGTRPGYESDADIAAHYQQYMGMDDPNAGYGDYSPAGVGDFSGAFNTWLTGAQSQFGKSLQEQLASLTEKAGARGRLQSGFYNKDTGTLSRQVAGDFSDKAQMAALDAAQLSYQASRDNAANGLSFARDRAAGRQDQSRNALSEALRRAEFLDSGRMGDFENDRDFDYGVYGDREAARRGNYESDRGYGRDVFESDRTFGSNRYDDDRDFGYQANRDDVGDWADNRDFMEDRFRFDTDQGNNDRDFYADWLAGQEDRNTEKSRYKAEQPEWWEKAIGAVAPIAQTAIGAYAGRRK